MIKTVNDYVDVMCERWPSMTREQILKILLHGFGKFFMHASDRHHFVFRSKRGVIACRYGNALKWYFETRYRTVRVLRWKYSYCKEEFDGHYYIGLTDGDWEKYKKKILNNESLTMSNIDLYKICEECIGCMRFKHFLKVYYPFDNGFKFTKDKLKTYRYAYIAYRNKKGRVLLIDYEHKTNSN